MGGQKLENLGKFDFSSMDRLPSRYQEERPFSLPPTPNEWEVLHRKVIHGEVTPEAAEQQIRGRGITFKMTPVFRNLPIAWNVEMVAAWITTENMAHVLRHHSDAWGRAKVWVKNNNIFCVKARKRIPSFLSVTNQGTRHGHDLITLERAPLGHRYYSFEGEDIKAPASDWDVELREKLFDGRITAIGYDRNVHPTEIPRSVWLEAKYVDCGNTTGLSLRGKTLYDVIAFRRSEILTMLKAKYVAPGSPDGVIGYRPWRGDLDPKNVTLVNATLLNLMKQLYPKGFPLFVSNKSRYKTLLAELHRYEINKWQNSQETFDRYMNDFRKKFSVGLSQSLD
ncbi:MAG: hypothetical protein EOP06_15530 [Proteobacteria bacterium]|nr:MAG: hypothetical protein EOP06_15530 [Pseudomonadota bacterium]